MGTMLGRIRIMNTVLSDSTTARMSRSNSVMAPPAIRYAIVERPASPDPDEQPFRYRHIATQTQEKRRSGQRPAGTWWRWGRIERPVQEHATEHFYRRSRQFSLEVGSLYRRSLRTSILSA